MRRPPDKDGPAKLTDRDVDSSNATLNSLFGGARQKSWMVTGSGIRPTPRPAIAKTAVPQVTSEIRPNPSIHPPVHNNSIPSQVGGTPAPNGSGPTNIRGVPIHEPRRTTSSTSQIQSPTHLSDSRLTTGNPSTSLTGGQLEGRRLSQSLGMAVGSVSRGSETVTVSSLPLAHAAPYSHIQQTDIERPLLSPTVSEQSLDSPQERSRTTSQRALSRPPSISHPGTTQPRAEQQVSGPQPQPQPQPGPGPRDQSSSPALTSTGVPRATVEPYQITRPGGLPPNPNKRIRIAPPSMPSLKARVSLIDQHIASVGGRQNLNNGLDGPRFDLLVRACNAEDIFYIALHQLFCIWDCNRNQVFTLPFFSNGVNLVVAFRILGQLIRDNQGLASAHLRWFTTFPSPLNDLMKTSEPYRKVMQDVAVFLDKLASNWTTVSNECEQRGYPLLVDEMVNYLGLLSPTLRGVVFTAIRRNLKIGDDVYGQEVEKCHEQDERSHEELAARYHTSRPPSEREIRERNQATINSLLHLHNQQRQERRLPQLVDIPVTQSPGVLPVPPVLSSNCNVQQTYFSGASSMPPTPPLRLPNGQIAEPNGNSNNQQFPNHLPPPLRTASTGARQIILPSAPGHPANLGRQQGHEILPIPTFMQNLSLQSQSPAMRSQGIPSPVIRSPAMQSPNVQSAATQSPSQSQLPQWSQQPQQHGWPENSSASRLTQGPASHRSPNQQSAMPQLGPQYPNSNPPGPEDRRFELEQSMRRVSGQQPYISDPQQFQLPQQSQQFVTRPQFQQPPHAQQQQNLSPRMRTMSQEQLHQMITPQQAAQLAAQQAPMQPSMQAHPQFAYARQQAAIQQATLQANPQQQYGQQQVTRPQAPGTPQVRVAANDHPRARASNQNQTPVAPTPSVELNPQHMEIIAYRNAAEKRAPRPLVPPAGFTYPSQPTNPELTALHQAHLQSPRLVPVGLDIVNRPDDDFSGRFYQVVKQIILGPMKVPINGLQRTPFSITQQEFDRRPVTKQTTSSRLPTREYQSGTIQFRLKCIQTRSEVTACRDPDWVISDIVWPEAIFMELNGYALEARRKLHHGKDLAVDLTPFMLPPQDNVPHTNEIIISVGESDQAKKGIWYFIAIESIEILSHAQILHTITTTQRIPASETLHGIQKALAPSNDDDDDDDFAMVPSDLTISLADPFTSQIFTVPARGKTCLHRECFDLETFLLTRQAKGKTRRPGQPCAIDVWKCPLCGVDARPQSLVVVDFLAGVRAELEGGGRLDTKFILVGADGRWRPKPEAPLPQKRKAPGEDSEDEDGEGKGGVERRSHSRQQSSSRRQSSAQGPIEIIDLDD